VCAPIDRNKGRMSYW